MPAGWGDYIHVSKEDQLTGDALREFAYPLTTTALSPDGTQSSAEFAKDGSVALRSPYIPGGMDTGKSWLEGDKLCVQLQKWYFGMVNCGAWYKNPRGTPQGQDEYVRFNDTGPGTFSRAR